VFDNSSSSKFLYESTDLMGLAALQKDDDVQDKKLVRRELRALHGLSNTFYEFQQEEVHEVHDGYEMVKQGDQTVKREVKSKVTVMMYYTLGSFSVKNMHAPTWVSKPDFHAQLDLWDGQGEAMLPRTQEMHTFTNVKTTISGSKIGIKPSFTRNESLQTLLYGHPRNEAHIKQRLPVLEKEVMNYRVGLLKKRAEDEAVLSSAFYCFVYQNDGISHADLISYLQNCEMNPEIKAIPTTHASGIQLLYAKWNYVMSHPSVGLWYLLFEDVWSQNKKMGALKSKGSALDPLDMDSLCYTGLLPRKELEKKLNKHGLTALQNCVMQKRLFYPRLLDALYERIANPSQPTSGKPSAKVVSA